MILNRDDGGFRSKRAISAFDENVIGKFQPLRDHEEDFPRRTELNHRFLQRVPRILCRLGAVVAVAAAIEVEIASATILLLIGAAQTNRNTYRRRVRKEPRQPACKIKLKSTSSGACLVGHV